MHLANSDYLAVPIAAQLPLLLQAVDFESFNSAPWNFLIVTD